MPQDDLKPFKNFRWIVADGRLLGGKLAIRGTRFSVAFILSCLAEGMTPDEIQETYGWVSKGGAFRSDAGGRRHPRRTQCGCLM